MDVTDKKSIESVVEKYDNIDILLNNAAKEPKVKKKLYLINKLSFNKYRIF